MLKALLLRARSRAVSALEYLGDEAHRRCVVALIVWAIVHFGGREIAPDVVDSGAQLVIAMLLAAWSSRTPKLDDGSRG